MAKSPKFINDKLPLGLNFSVFYNKSKNFQPDAGRLDLIGNRVASPAGDTKDYGFTVAALDNKLTLKINWYETNMTNATLGGAIGNFYLIGAGEAWCQAKAVDTRDGKGSMATVWGTSSSGGAVRWQPAGNGGVDGASSVGSYTQAELDAQYAIQQASVTAWFANQIPTSMQTAWGMTGLRHRRRLVEQRGPKIAITGDTSRRVRNLN
ncbi:MAG: hypothetical protein IPL39_11160 [Opitutaceae bacterium]|nr:hypothetical protein [Opitutaceae bacterium]